MAPITSSSLENVWSRLESLRGLCGVEATWRSDLGPVYPTFKAAFLQRAPEPASCIPCPRGCGCHHEVIQLAPGEWVGVCGCESWNCDDLPLTPEQIAVWQLNWSKLGRGLCQALGLESKRAEFELNHTRQIGAWGAEAVPVILSLPTDRHDFLFVLGQLCARLRQPFILLAPTARNLDARGQELLANVGAGFFDLASHVAFTSEGALRSLRTPGELFARFNPLVKEALDEDAARKAFALVQALDSEQPVRKASLYTVFRLFCMENLNAAQVARKCGCARSLIFSRLNSLAKKLGADPRSLRRYSAHFERMEDSLHEPRARRVHRRTAIYGEAENEEAGG